MGTESDGNLPEPIVEPEVVKPPNKTRGWWLKFHPKAGPGRPKGSGGKSQKLRLTVRRRMIEYVSEDLELAKQTIHQLLLGGNPYPYIALVRVLMPPNEVTADEILATQEENGNGQPKTLRELLTQNATPDRIETWRREIEEARSKKPIVVEVLPPKPEEEPPA
jgi:hypothetical protein